MFVIRIISGAQTGADRAALDWAIANRVEHGGWCPKGRRSEDGPIHLRYQVKETPSSDYAQRTEWNVRDSDGTVIFSLAEVLTGGSKKTQELAAKHQKNCLHLSKHLHGDKAAEMLRDFLFAFDENYATRGRNAIKEPQKHGKTLTFNNINPAAKISARHKFLSLLKTAR